MLVVIGGSFAISLHTMAKATEGPRSDMKKKNGYHCPSRNLERLLTIFDARNVSQHHRSRATSSSFEVLCSWSQTCEAVVAEI